MLRDSKMANGFTLPPWLARPTDPVGAFQRSTQIVNQQQQARQELEQRAAEAAQRAALASAEMAQQAQFQQAAQRLKEQGIKADIESEAARLRLGQEAERRKGEEAASIFKAQTDYERRIAAGQDPRKALLELGPRMFGSAAGLEALTRPPRTPVDLTKLGSAEQVLDAQGNLLGHRIPTSERGTVFRSVTPDTSAKEAARAVATQTERATRAQEQVAMGDIRALQRARPNIEAFGTPEEKAAFQQQWQAATNTLAQLRPMPAAQKAEEPQDESAQGTAIIQARVVLANQLEKQHPDWTKNRIKTEVLRQIP